MEHARDLAALPADRTGELADAVPVTRPVFAEGKQ
jgi:hypothetical protein